MIVNKISFNHHLLLALTIRITLIIYGEIHDQTSELPYTDIDYKVVTDGARHILQNNSPFQRHTYRYSPLLAILLIPNIILHKSFGKILFSIFDILVGYLIERIIYNELKFIFIETAETLFLIRQNQKQQPAIKFPIEQQNNINLTEKYHNWSKYSALFWLYNPLSMIISTRGNGDSISCFFVLLTLYFLQKTNYTNFNIFLAGLCHGFTIHLRIYPIIFSLAYYLYLISDQNYRIDNYQKILKTILWPNKKQLLLISGTILSLLLFTGGFFYIYKWEYINEAYLYHFIRKDIRHNFSMLFLLQYLSSTTELLIIEKLLLQLPQLIIFIYLSFTFGRNRKTLSFCIFTQTFCMVTYNSVVTSQYFVWYLALLPLCFKNLRKIPIHLAGLYFTLWMFGQALWLLPAYLLEFKSLNTFNFIGIQSVAFFFINIFILQRIIRYFDVFSTIKIN